MVIDQVEEHSVKDEILSIDKINSPFKTSETNEVYVPKHESNNQRYEKHKRFRKCHRANIRAKPYQWHQFSKTHKMKRSHTRNQQLLRSEMPNECTRTYNKTRYTCDQCRNTFRHKAHLKRHQQIHSGERFYKCNHCSKSFKHKIHLIQHQQMHNTDKPYQFGLCNKANSFNQLLIEHMKTQQRERHFQCEECNKSFTIKSNLTLHYLIHSLKESYHIEQYNKTFTRTFTRLMENQKI